MLMNEYQKATRGTAVYPNIGSNPAYATLGLSGETAETFEKIAEGNVDTTEILKELGDVLWYAATLSWEAGLPLSGEEEDRPFPRLVSDGVRSRKSTGDDLVVAVGKVSEIVKKVMRDADGKFDEYRRDLLREQMKKVLNAAAQVAYAYGGDLSSVAEGNLEKLASRAERGVLKGDGDNR